MARDDEFLIELDPEGEASAAKKADAEVKPERSENKANDDAIEAMRRQLKAMEDERNDLVRRNQEAERKASEAADVASRAKTRATQSEYDMVSGYIATAKSRADSIKRELKAAHESGDTDRITDLQMEAAAVGARLLQYEDAKVDIEARVRVEKERAETEVKRPERQADPFEAYVAPLSRESQSWLRQHRECVTDPASNAKVIWGHQEALKKGLRADSQEYFQFLDEHMGYAQPRQQQEQDQGDEPEVEIVESKPEPRRTMPAAPVSRGAIREGQIVGNKVRLTREQAEMAESLGMTPAEYAQSLVKLTKEGRYPNVYN